MKKILSLLALAALTIGLLGSCEIIIGPETPKLPDGALAGEFSVSATKTVYFSPGNLYWDGSKFKFEANQYGRQNSWSTSHVSHFYWSKDASVAYDEKRYNQGSASGSDVFFTNKEDIMVNVDGIDKTGWRTLSKDEWTYLFNNHLYKLATVNAKPGYVIAPDGFAGTLSDNYADDAALATAGNLVFLPAAGYRYGSYVNEVGSDGFYWSSTADDGDHAYFVYFNLSDGVRPDDYGYRDGGYSVRLITECQ